MHPHLPRLRFLAPLCQHRLAEWRRLSDGHCRNRCMHLQPDRDRVVKIVQYRRGTPSPIRLLVDKKVVFLQEKHGRGSPF